MFTNCSTLSQMKFLLLYPLCWKFHLCWFQLYNLQHNERVGREDQHKLWETDYQERRPRCFHVAYLPWSCCCFHLWRFFLEKIAYVPEAFFLHAIYYVQSAIRQLSSHFKLSRQKMMICSNCIKSHLCWSWSVKFLSLVILFDWQMDIDAGLRHAHSQKNLKSFVTLLDVTLWSMGTAERSWPDPIWQDYIFFED